MINVIDKTVTELTSTEPVTASEVKTHLNITDSAWDAEIATLITQCRRAMEDFTGRSLIYKRITIYADYTGEWWLPYPPIIGIEQVANKDTTIGSGIPGFTTLTSDWEVSPGEAKKFSYAVSDYLKITYTAGYTTLPANLKLALLNEIYHRFENKGQSGNSICEPAEKLAAPYVRHEYSI